MQPPSPDREMGTEAGGGGARRAERVGKPPMWAGRAEEGRRGGRGRSGAAVRTPGRAEVMVQAIAMAWGVGVGVRGAEGGGRDREGAHGAAGSHRE